MSADAPKEKTRLTLPVGRGDHRLGPENAPIVLVEYGNYECPHCRRFHPILKARRKRLGDKLQYVFRHLPTEIHPHSQLAAEAAEAAAAQDRFWKMHNRLFEHREADGVLDEAQLIKYAAEIGLDVEQFSQDLRGHRYAERVQEDFLSGVESGVNGTPTFFLNGERYDEAWDLYSVVDKVEKPLGVKIRLLAQDFASIAASGSIVLLICTILAVLWANSPWGETYFHFWETDFGLVLGNLSLSEHLLGWVNDGLMAIFFFMVGLEIKREVMTGELASPKRAALPIAGAIGGMVAPALIYTLFNAGQPSMPGWGIPMATDIAFTLGVLAVLGSRVPLALKIFFTALAIADDLGAVIVIALFYTAHIEWVALGIGGVILLLLIGLNRAKIYWTVPYVLLGFGLWLAFLESGIHATIAGVLLALTIPARTPINIRPLLVQVQSLVDDFELPPQWRAQVDSRRQATIQMLENITDKMQSPSQRLERKMHYWTVFMILPIFALANAGVALDVSAFQNLLSPVSLGIILGLVVGKPLGITLISWLAVKAGVAELPLGVTWRLFFASSFLAGIGFTMSIFIAGAAFTDPGLLASAKLAIFIASITAGLLGWGLVIAMTSHPQPRAVETVSPAK